MSKSNMQKILENRNKGKSDIFNPAAKKGQTQGAYNHNPKGEKARKILPSNKVFYYIQREINGYQDSFQQNYNPFLIGLEKIIF